MSAPNEPGAHNPACQTRALMLAAVIAAALVLARAGLTCRLCGGSGVSK